MAPTEDRFDRIETSLTEIKDQIDQIDQAIRGNGKVGLGTRLALVEADVKSHKWTWRIIAATVIGIIVKTILG
ncbi:MAG: hypothetical protein GY869_28010 [Planctomycetes bacterium]|nr:hypothetical protein [Planctomycetota bacterium]